MNKFIVGLLLLAGCSSAFSQEIVKPVFSMSAGEEPEQKAWTQPASFAYTKTDGKSDSWAIDLAAKIEGQVANFPNTFFIRGKVQKNTLEEKETESYGAELGYTFDFDTAGHSNTSDKPNLDAWYFFGDVTMGYIDKSIFPDPKAICTITPLPVECLDQNERSLRTTVKLMPFRSDWETTFYVNPQNQKASGPAWTYSVAPIVSIFNDQIIDAKINAAGAKADGGVSGARLEINAALSPRFTNYRLVLRGSYQTVIAFSRDSNRRQGFLASSEFYKLSVDYDLGLRSFEEGVSGWVPTLGVSYVHGDDPLSGRLDQNTLVANLKITYRAR